ncbi:hypothetical protein [Proteus columbae]|uniref:hypothetical protein n=1 Tax=Proteus columbae TaxID=1987580 RepID=UPI00288AC82F|nr:hypothetical protein [Proteus columbae]
MPIIPEVVERNEDGYWVHSKLPYSETGSEITQWLSDNKLDQSCVYMSEDVDEDAAVFQNYFTHGNTNVSAWIPTELPGEGWFIGAIYESEEGPVCLWLRSSKYQLKEQFLKAHREAEKTAYAYFCACDVGKERIQASEIYQRIRTATYIGG